MDIKNWKKKKNVSFQFIIKEQLVYDRTDVYKYESIRWSGEF